MKVDLKLEKALSATLEGMKGSRFKKSQELGFSAETAKSQSRLLLRKQKAEIFNQANILELSKKALQKFESKPFFVGELGKQWEFPNDHLPIGMEINGLHFANWNILNTAYLHHIINNGQGLKDSLIMEANVPGSGPRLTLREEIVLDQVLRLLLHPTTPRSVLSLQETGSAFWEVLKERLPENFKTVTTFPGDLVHGDVFIYDSDRFEFTNLESKGYECHPANTMMSMTLLERSTGQLYRFIQSHLPGGPVKSEPARKEFADFVMDQFDPKMAIILMGDMNRPPAEFMANFQKSAEIRSMEQPFRSAPIPYPTHINTHRQASWIDNLFVFLPQGMQMKISKEDSFFAELKKMIDLLKQLQTNP